MKLLITGGAGFIGSHIADAYVRDGHEVVIIDNLSGGFEHNLNPKAKFYRCDICAPEAGEIVAREQPDVLSHHAAQIDVRKSMADPLFDLRVNVGGLINLLEAGRRNGLKKVIFASSGGTVYGEQDVFPADENHPTRPVSPYGLNKLASEQYLYFVEKAYGIPWVALRYANVYGPRQNAHGEAGVVAVFTRAILSKETPTIHGDGLQTRDYVYVDDVVEANRCALTDRACGAYNVGTGVEHSVVDVVRLVTEYAGGRSEPHHGPAKAGEQRRSSLSAARLTRELRWKPQVDFDEGIRKTVEWFLKKVKR